MKINGSQNVTMWRCSQCKTGLVSRSSEDELMLRLIGDPLNKDQKGYYLSATLFIALKLIFLFIFQNTFREPQQH